MPIPSKKARVDASEEAAELAADVVKTEPTVSKLKVENGEAFVQGAAAVKADGEAAAPAETAGDGEQPKAPDPAKFWAELQGTAPDGQVRHSCTSHTQQITLAPTSRATGT